jgi:hypothetical protein
MRFAPGLGLDLYYFGLRRKDALLDAGVGDEERHTFGLRAFGRAAAIDYNFEADYQTGAFDGRTIKAFAAFSDTGYTLRQVWAKPRLALKADLASGGDSKGTGDLDTFYPLFPKNNYFSEAGVQTPMNYIDAYPYITIQPRGDLAFRAGLEFLWRQNTKDSFYEAPGIPLLAGDANANRYIGELLNTQVEWQAAANINVNLVYAHQYAAGYLKDAGAKSLDFGTLWATYHF